jgi:hypothetical protein
MKMVTQRKTGNKILLTALFSLFSVLTTMAQTVTIGTGTSSGLTAGSGATTLQSPYNSYYGYSYAQTLYQKSEINAIGNITAIKYYYDGTSLDNSNVLKVYMAHVSRSAFSSTTDWEPLANLTLVFDDTISATVPGWVTIPLSTPFSYNNTDNLLIAVDENRTGDNGTTGYRASELGDDRVIFKRSDNTDPDPATPGTADGLSRYVGNIQIEGLTLGCQLPGNIQVPAPTATSATVTWTAPAAGPAVGQYDWEIRTSGAPGSGNPTASDTTSATTFSSSVLTANTTYSVYLRSLCGGSANSGWTTATTFTTPCASLIPPTAVEGFEGSFLPVCWNQASGLLANPTVFGINNDNWAQGDYAGVAATNKAARINIYGTNRKDWLISPPIDLGTSGNTQLEFDIACTEWGSTAAAALGADDTVAVVISTDNGLTWSSANVLRKWSAGTPIANGAGDHIVLDLGAYSGVVKLAFYGESTVSNVDIALYIDNFKVVPVPACQIPLGLTVNSFTHNTSAFSWTASTSATAMGYQWEVRTSGAPGSGSPSASGSTLSPVVTATATGLSPLTTYYVYVRAQCGPATFSDWSSSATFITRPAPQVPAVLPYTETFSGTPQWTILNGAQKNKWFIGSATGNTGNSLYIDSLNGNTNAYNEDISSVVQAYREVTLPSGTNELKLKFDWKCKGEGTSGNNYDYFTIWLVANNIYPTPGTQMAPGAGIMQIGSYFKDPATATAVWKTDSFQFSSGALAGTTAKLIIEWKNDGSTANQPPAAIDNIYFREITCPDATNLAVSNITTSSAQLSWTGNAPQYRIEYGPAGFTPGTGQMVTATSNPYTLNNLVHNTSYQFYVRKVCTPGVDSSTRTGPKGFGTLCAPPVVTAADVERCGPGILTLNATANQANANFKWFTTPTGGTPAGTGAAFTTPSLTNNTTYYVTGGNTSSGTATLGAGALTSVSGNPDFLGVSPYAYHYGNYKHQYLIHASELTALGITGGQLNSIAFDVASVGSSSTFNNFKISLKPTSANSMTTAFETGLTELYTAAATTPVVGINTYNFNNAFTWDGVSNIVVQVCWNNNNSGDVTSSAEVKYDNTPFVSNATQRLDGVQNDMCDVPTAVNSAGDGPTASKRPKMLFNYNSGCESVRIPVQAIIKPAPLVNLGPDIATCTDGTATETLDAGNPGASYLWDNGSTAATRVVSANGTYHVAVSANGCTTHDTIEVVFNPEPTVTLGNDTAICDGVTLMLHAVSPAAVSYRWNDNSTNATKGITAAGSYSVAVTDVNSCVGRDTIVVVVNANPVVNLGNDTSICAGTELVLNAGNPGAVYLWDDASTQQSRMVHTTGTYSVVVKDGNKCTASDAIHVIVKEAPSVDGINAVYGDGVYTFNALNPEFVTTYEWNFGDGSAPVTGAVVQHTYTTNGIFTVTLDIGGDCGTTGSHSVTVDNFGLGLGNISLNNTELSVYPNPTSDILTIENKSGLKMKQVTVHNVLGQVMYRKIVDKTDKHQFHTSSFAAGVYSIRIETEKGFVIRKFEVVR